MAPPKSSKGEATTKEESGEFKQHLGGSYKTCLLTRVLVKRALTVHIIIKIEQPSGYLLQLLVLSLVDVFLTSEK